VVISGNISFTFDHQIIIDHSTPLNVFLVLKAQDLVGSVLIGRLKI
jgi:hypothetical protein